MNAAADRPGSASGGARFDVVIQAWMSEGPSGATSKLQRMAGLFGKNKLRELAQQIKTDEISAHVELIRTWQEDYHNGSLKKDNETVREQQYNQDFFITILGYRQQPIVPTTFTPKNPTVKGQFPDAVLHYKVAAVDNVSAVVELKGAAINLDKPQQREGNFSPVQQAFKYKPQYPSCPFVVVSNFWEFRLYNNNQLDYESWTLDELIDPADDYLKFKTWYVLMHADNMVVQSGPSTTEKLLSVIRHDQEEIGKQFYTDYKAARIELLRDIWRNNPDLRENFDVAIEKAQTIIDRLVFCCFAEDIGLLPDDVIGLVMKQAGESLYNEPISEHFKRFFKAVDKGSTALGIPEGYNGGLFAEDELIDKLVISDDVMKQLVGLANYDFEEDLPVNILGHIFEQSITNLEEIRRKIAADNDPMGLEPPEETASGLRRREGIYYTPDYIVQYIVDNTLGAYLREKEKELQDKHRLTGRLGERGYEARQQQAYLEYQTVLQNVKVIDPACGSGAFLVHVFDYLLKENSRVDDILGGSLTSLEDFVRSILTDNIFGVDLNQESVEITKLSLWLKTAERGKKLTTLDANIRSGNSLIKDGTITDTAFNWEEQFPEVMAKGGFDVVVGNPPYVSAIEMNKHLPLRDRTFMRANYDTAEGAVDLYIYFFERGVQLLKKGGKLGFITPNRWLSVGYGSALRGWLIDNVRIESILNCSDSRVFPDAATYPVVTIMTKTEMGDEHYKITAGHLEEMTAVPAADQHDSSNLSALPENIWGFLLNDKLPITQKIFDQAVRLGLAGEINATSTAGEADDYAAFISDQPGQKIINTGTIDPYTSMWGLTLFTKQGRRSMKPYLDLDKVSEGRKKLYESPKIIVAKLALRCEAVYDSAGQYASIDTNCVHSFTDDFVPEYVLAWMNSRLYTYVFTCLFDGARMGGGYLGFSAPALRATPIAKLDPAKQQVFVDPATKLSQLHRAKAEADVHFKSIIRTTFELTTWGGANNTWWLLESPAFVKNFKKRFTTSQVEDMMAAHAKHSATMTDIVNDIFKLTKEIDQRLYKTFKLTADEIASVEAMEFAVI